MASELSQRVPSAGRVRHRSGVCDVDVALGPDARIEMWIRELGAARSAWDRHEKCGYRPCDSQLRADSQIGTTFAVRKPVKVSGCRLGRVPTHAGAQKL